MIYLLREMSVSDALKTLGIDGYKDVEELKQVHRNLSKIYHPDVKGGDTDKMQKINQAYDILKDRAIGKTFEPIDYEAARKRNYEKNLLIYPQMEKLFYKSFNEENLLEYLQTFIQEELFVDVEIKKPTKNKLESLYLSFVAEVKVHNKDNTLVFYVKYIISPVKSNSSGLGNDTLDETDLLFEFDISNDIYFNKRKHKLSKRTYQWRVGSKVLEDYSLVFPKVKLKKIFSVNTRKSFKKSDMWLGLQRELPYISGGDNDTIFIYPFGKDVKFYFPLLRSVFLRLPYYQFVNVQAIDPKTDKYYHPSLRLDYGKLDSSIEETEETLTKLIACVQKLIKTVKTMKLDVVQDSQEIFEILQDLLIETFPRKQQ